MSPDDVDAVARAAAAGLAAPGCAAASRRDDRARRLAEACGGPA